MGEVGEAEISYSLRVLKKGGAPPSYPGPQTMAKVYVCCCYKHQECLLVVFFFFFNIYLAARDLSCGTWNCLSSLEHLGSLVVVCGI